MLVKERLMATIHIKQRFHASVEDTFHAVTPHKMLAESLPVFVDVVKTSDNGGDGLGSVRAMGLPFFKPLQEEVVLYEPPHRLEYKVVGIGAKLIDHHYGVITFTEKSNETIVEWTIQLRTKPKFLSNITLAFLKRSIKQALVFQAKKLHG